MNDGSRPYTREETVEQLACFVLDLRFQGCTCEPEPVCAAEPAWDPHVGHYLRMTGAHYLGCEYRTAHEGRSAESN